MIRAGSCISPKLLKINLPPLFEVLRKSKDGTMEPLSRQRMRAGMGDGSRVLIPGVPYLVIDYRFTSV
jgi:hypothetical protein